MKSSYGETSGFLPVSGDELTTVNGGVDPFTIVMIVAGVLLAGCAQPTNPDDLNKNAPVGGGKR